MYSECHWVWGLNDKAKPGPDVKTHVHDFDEVLCFIGSNKEDPTDLGAEIEIWIDGKKYIITKTCMIYVPRGTKHLPLRFLKINRPFIFATHGNGQYNVIGQERTTVVCIHSALSTTEAPSQQWNHHLVPRCTQ